MSKPVALFTNEEMKNTQNTCPVKGCGSDEVTGGSVDIDDSGVSQGVSCDQCGAEWRVDYVFHSIALISNPTEPVAYIEEPVAAVVKPAKLIPCPECQNEEHNPEHVGFTFPSNVTDGKDYIVCQNCGRRTLEGEWNDLDAKVYTEVN